MARTEEHAAQLAPSHITTAGFLRLHQIIGDAKRGIEPLIPVSAATWWRGCKSGAYPKPVKLSRNVTVWRRAEILAILQRGSGAA